MCPPNPLPPADAVRTVRKPDGTFTYLTESSINLQTSALESTVVLLESAVSLLEAIESNTDGIEGSLTTLNAKDFATQTTLATRASETSMAAAATSLSIMDDWDESDRAKVNPIAGQVGVQGGLGAVTALTQRVVEARSSIANPTQVSVATAATLLLASNSSRRRSEIYNSSNASVYLGDDNTVTTSTGYELPSGANFTEPDYTGDIYGIVSSGTKTVAMWEVS